jgi:hypothetical protein
MKLAAVVLLLSAALYGQEKIKPLSAEEELAIREPQVRALQAQANMNAAKDAYSAAQQELNAANAEAQKAVDAVYASRHLTKEEATVCPGVAPGPCASAPANRLSLQPLSKAKSEDKLKGPTTPDPAAKK